MLPHFLHFLHSKDFCCVLNLYNCWTKSLFVFGLLVLKLFPIQMIQISIKILIFQTRFFTSKKFQFFYQLLFLFRLEVVLLSQMNSILTFEYLVGILLSSLNFLNFLFSIKHLQSQIFNYFLLFLLNVISLNVIEIYYPNQFIDFRQIYYLTLILTLLSYVLNKISELSVSSLISR